MNYIYSLYRIDFINRINDLFDINTINRKNSIIIYHKIAN